MTTQVNQELEGVAADLPASAVNGGLAQAVNLSYGLRSLKQRDC